MEAVAIRKITVEEFLEMDFDDPNAHLYELIDGEVVKKSAPAPIHQRLSFGLIHQFGQYVVPQNLGAIYHAPIDVFLDGINSVQPDILFIPTDSLDIVTEDGIEGVPTLIVEIISHLVEIYALQQGRYALLSAATPTEGAIRSEILPGLTLDVNALFTA